VQVSYDPKRNIAYLRLRDVNVAGCQVETLQLSDEINIDIAPDGAVYGIELLNANSQLGATEGGNFVLEFAGQRVELPLPEAV